MNNKYETSDIVEASFLIAGCEYTLSSITLDGNKGIFHFSHVDQAVLDNFNIGNAKVEPIKFHNTVKQLTTAVRKKRS